MADSPVDTALAEALADIDALVVMVKDGHGAGTAEDELAAHAKKRIRALASVPARSPDDGRMPGDDFGFTAGPRSPDELTEALKRLAACGSHLTALGRPDLAPFGEQIVCPRCDGQTYDVGACGVCRNIGWLDENGESLFAALARSAGNGDEQ